MNQKRISFIFLAIGVLLVTGSVFLMTATPVKAQCGSQASSCKNCHETQAQDPVNNDATTWHTQHAFGDFCYLCHAGNNQATDKVTAHTGMVDPLSDIDASCKSCHPTDTLAKAQIYATTLGKQVGTGGSTASSDQPTATAAPAAAGGSAAPAGPAVVGGSQTTQLDVNDPNLVDYVQRYDAVVLGKQPVNIGNIIMIAILALLVLGGGFFVLRREGWINIAFEDPKRVAVTKKYPADVVEMLPGLSRLKPASRRTLLSILAKPRVAADLLASIDGLTHEEPAVDQSSEDQPSEEVSE